MSGYWALEIWLTLNEMCFKYEIHITSLKVSPNKECKIPQ